MFSITWIEVAGGFEPCEGRVVVGSGSEDLFEESTKSRVDIPKIRISLVNIDGGCGAASGVGGLSSHGGLHSVMNVMSILLSNYFSV